jgi:hypothetical protein
MEQLKHEQAESREREREISPVPGLSRGRDETMERQSRSDTFLDSHGTAVNLKDVSPRNGKRYLIGSQALMEQLKT